MHYLKRGMAGAPGSASYWYFILAAITSGLGLE
jgi:hypothetical protein